VRHVRAIALIALGMTLAGLAGSFARAQFSEPRPFDPADKRTTLAHVENAVTTTSGVPEVGVRDLEDMLDEADTVLFDVRTAAEFEAGRLPGAIRIEPGMSTHAFLRDHGRHITNKVVIFYCSVGVRSSNLALRLRAETRHLSPIGQFNLRGGVFRWVVDGRALVDSDGPGRLLPYNKDWGKLLARALAVK
jgi:rhodanese-related sulfurtransferase